MGLVNINLCVKYYLSLHFELQSSILINYEIFSVSKIMSLERISIPSVYFSEFALLEFANYHSTAFMLQCLGGVLCYSFKSML